MGVPLYISKSYFYQILFDNPLITLYVANVDLLEVMKLLGNKGYQDE